MNYKLLFLDTETTGNTETDRLTQVAYKFLGDKECKVELFKPPVPISIESMEVTHITERMVADKEPFIDSPMFKELQTMFEDENVVFVAHNAPFDVDMLKKEGIEPQKVIDTLRVARHLDTEAKLTAFRLQYLRYLLDLDSDIDEAIQAHDAKGDVLVLEKLYQRLFTKMKEEGKSDDEVVEAMIDISLKPSIIRRFSFGKYNGEKLEDVAGKDRGYLEWLYGQKKQSESDETDWLYTLEQFLT